MSSRNGPAILHATLRTLSPLPTGWRSLEPPVWDFRPARSGLLLLWHDVIRLLPFIAFGLLTLALSAGAGILATRGARAFLRRRVRTKLLQNVIARGAGGLVLLCGAYLVLRVSGLTQLALTVVGGTGLIGLVVGIAFREITENFLASIFLSLQRPFETGDLVEVSGVTGYVQQLNMRTTILMTLDGNLVQIPNASGLQEQPLQLHDQLQPERGLCRRHRL